MTLDTRSPVAPAAPITIGVLPLAPRAAECLKCQMYGKRRLTCSKSSECSELPLSFALGPVLLGAWLVTAIAFVIAVL